VSELGRTARWPAVFLTGASIGLVETLLAVAFASVVFGGAISYRLPEGVGLHLGAAFLALAIFAWRSGTRGVVGGLQGITVALLAVVAATTGVRARGSAHDGFLAVVAASVVVTVLCGALFLLLGTRRRGDLIRHIPIPVVGGAIAGAGWLLIQGGIHMAIDEPLFYTHLAELFDGRALRLWVPAVVFGAVLMLAARRLRTPFAIPVTIGVGLAGFAAVALAMGASIDDVRRGGWLFGGLDGNLTWKTWGATALVQADWLAVARSWPAILVAVAVSAPAMLMNVARTEDLLDRDLDTDRELRDAGLANLLTGAAGGIPSFHSVDLTRMTIGPGVDARRAGWVAAVVPLAALLVGASVLELVPRMIVGGLLVFLGLTFIIEWVWDRRTTLPRIEYVVVLVILAVVIARGYLSGIVVGLVAGVALLAVNYGRLDLLREVPFGDVYRSDVDRPPVERERLRAMSDRVQILRVSGHLFFGSTNRLLDHIRARAEGAEPPRFVVIDLGRVTGVDASVVAALAKAERVVAPHGTEIVLTRASEGVRARLERGGALDADGVVSFEADLASSLRRCEEALLEGSPVKAATGDGLPAGLAAYLERVSLDERAVLLRQGDPPGDVYVLAEGRLAVEILTPESRRVRVRTLLPGVVVGEVALYTGTPRTADVVAETPCVVLRCSSERIARIETEDPDVAAELHRWLAATLAGRLSDEMRAVDALLG